MAEEEFRYEVVRALRAHALSFPEVHEGTSCVNRAFKARTKNFLFLGEKEDEYRIMLRLENSVAEARKLVADHDRWTIGNTKWVTMLFGPDEAPPSGLVERWIEESYRTLAPKKLVRELDG
ncbi:MAG: MmcQ/YjbR family DNA-binding protein [Actinomycetota bacterium]